MADRLIVLVVALAVAVVLGLLGRWRDRQAERRGFDSPQSQGAAASTSVVALPEGATGAVVVLGTRACTTCARTHALLTAEAAGTHGAVAAEHVLLEDRPDLVASLDVRTAPTVVLLDGSGTVVGRHDGGLDAAGAARAVASLVSQGAR